MVKENGMVMMTVEEFAETANKVELLKNEIRELREALLIATRNRDKEAKKDDIRVSMATFYNLTQEILKRDDGDTINMETDIFGHDVTVHFHGLYCDCYDGASVFNTVIEAVGECAKEYDDEDILVESEG